jgi:hypothetical protein
LNFLAITPVSEPIPSTGRLGDWYANLVPTDASDLIVFVNERSLVTVAIPAREAENIVSQFRARVQNLLAMLGVSIESIRSEIGHYQQVQFAKTSSRSVLGSMNDIASNYQFMAEGGGESGYLSLSDTEYELSNMPSIARKIFPSDAAKELLEPKEPPKSAR